MRRRSPASSSAARKEDDRAVIEAPSLSRTATKQCCTRGSLHHECREFFRRRAAPQHRPTREHMQALAARRHEPSFRGAVNGTASGQSYHSRRQPHGGHGATPEDMPDEPRRRRNVPKNNEEPRHASNGHHRQVNTQSETTMDRMRIVSHMHVYHVPRDP